MQNEYVYPIQLHQNGQLNQIEEQSVLGAVFYVSKILKYTIVWGVLWENQPDEIDI